MSQSFPSKPQDGAFSAQAASFLAEDTGAVTVDWVVLTSAVVGLGIATLGVVSAGVGSSSNAIADELAGTSIQAAFSRAMSLFSNGFENGRGGFAGGQVVNAPGFGNILQLGQNDVATLSVDVPDGASSATIQFDLIGADDFDGDSATVYVNGQPVSIYTDDNGNVTATDISGNGVTVAVDQQYTDYNGGGRSLGDSRATYTITVDNPGSNVTFGVGSDNTADAGNEYFALDDVRVSSN
ncbi:MAG: hypothetical protein AAGA70_09330 [Pseudomonadota bacterium]